MQHYHCSNGTTYSGQEIWERLEAGIWEPCCWDAETGEEWMASVEGRLLHLVPVDLEAGETDHLPGRIER